MQSVSFVLTAPIFIMLMLLAVQISQLMIGLMTVHYAAYAAARSASVWIPARMEPLDSQGENRIGLRMLEGVYFGGIEYRILHDASAPKQEQIRRAAALACVPIAPSRSVGISAGDSTSGSLQSIYGKLAPGAMANARIPDRLNNKWGYANAATTIDIRVFHPDEIEVDAEPPLIQFPPFMLETEFTPYEIGWRDQVRITVTHQFALLPGPGRLLARRASESVVADRISPQILEQNSVYYIPLSATATVVPEGEKSVRPYVQTPSN
ncbi:MAG: pilus assembly protein [Planctomycetaceae bacterium]|nr:pilus assembly protein [Planctomycetaceae bacterium]